MKRAICLLRCLLHLVAGLTVCLPLALSAASAQSPDRLPDAPHADAAADPHSDADDGRPATGPRDPRTVAPIYTKYIRANQQAQPLPDSGKFVFGLRDAFAPESPLIWTLAAGYGTAVNGMPNYGQTPIAFAKRLGAAAIRDPSDTLLVDSVFAPIFHEDPRYYKIGRGNGSVGRRALYAITRPLITRTNSGRLAPNAALLTGDLAGTILTNTYYPQMNRGFGETAKSYGGSLGAIALGNLFQEFLDDAAHMWRGQRDQRGR